MEDFVGRVVTDSWLNRRTLACIRSITLTCSGSDKVNITWMRLSNVSCAIVVNYLSFNLCDGKGTTNFWHMQIAEHFFSFFAWFCYLHPVNVRFALEFQLSGFGGQLTSSAFKKKRALPWWGECTRSGVAMSVDYYSNSYPLRSGMVSCSISYSPAKVQQNNQLCKYFSKKNHYACIFDFVC